MTDMRKVGTFLDVPFYHPADKPIPMLRSEDEQPVIRARAHARIFNLRDVQQLSDYEAVFQAVADGTAMVEAEERWKEADGVYLAFVRWSAIFSTMPDVKELPEDARETIT